MTYSLPKIIHPNGAIGYYLNEEMAKIFAELYPITMNSELREMFGISTHTINKFKKELGLKKNMEVICHKHAQQVKKICEENGYYQSIKGKRMHENCLKAVQEKRKTGWTPLRDIKEKDPERFKEIQQRRSKARKETFEREKKHVKWGLDQTTRLHIPYEKFKRKDVSRRYKAVQKGYILGSTREFSGERYTFYYTDTTHRAPIFEKNSIKAGFRIEPYTKRNTLG